LTAPVAIRRVTQRYGAQTVLHDISLDIAAGEYIVLLGPSGCGKTTLLNILGGFATPTSGTVLIGGRDMGNIAPKDRPTTTVFQDYALFPHLSLQDNVAFGLRMKGIAAAPRRAKALEMLDMVGLKAMSTRRPHELSGGQRQRVALARALAVEPDVLLLDEPLGALDLKLRRQMQDELKSIQRRVGTTFVHVTHDQEEAMAIADRIVVMRAGRIEQAAPARDVYLHPANLFVADFMGEVNRIPIANGQSPLGPLLAGTGTICLRPEAIGTTGPLALGLARVTDAAFFGTHIRAHMAPLAAPGLTLIVHFPQGAIVTEGDEIPLFARDPVLLEAAP
jgi:spermidine/putrescine transport system ATP-binding protein